MLYIHALVAQVLPKIMILYLVHVFIHVCTFAHYIIIIMSLKHDCST